MENIKNYINELETSYKGVSPEEAMSVSEKLQTASHDLLSLIKGLSMHDGNVKCYELAICANDDLYEFEGEMRSLAEYCQKQAAYYESCADELREYRNEDYYDMQRRVYYSGQT